MIDSLEIFDHLAREPFRPFCIRTSDGRSIEIRYPEAAGVGRSSMTVSTALADVPGAKGSWHHIPFAQIDSLDVIEASVAREAIERSP